MIAAAFTFALMFWFRKDLNLPIAIGLTAFAVICIERGL